ncbi:MAG TPA: response regulator [Crinalium sp.]
MTTILVIEDDWILQESIQSLLEGEGFDTLGAKDGRMGIDLAVDRVPDLILCDIQMPDVDGYEVLTTLQKHEATATIPFIFLTAKDNKDDLRQGMSLGADDYLTKPFDPDELLNAIASRLEKRSLYQSKTQKQLDELRNHIVQFLPHEFRTPLTGILTSVELLRLDPSDQESVLETANNIQGFAERLYRLVRNYLLYVKLETALHDPQQRESFTSSHTNNLNFLIKDTATHIAKQAQRETDLYLDLQTATVAMAETNFLKVIEELTDNAFKFSNRGTPVQIKSVADEGGFTVAIANQGRGMTPEQIEQIGAYMQFERDMYEQQGAGLGLVIAKRLLELHDGTLTIESTPEQTTTVAAVFPVA